MTLTNHTYIVHHLGLICPNCQSRDIEAIDYVTVHIGCATQHVMCNVCAATWDDQYNLVSYENLEVPDTRITTLDKREDGNG